MNRSEGSPVLRIDELSRRLGVSDHVLRPWESRYGLLQPARSAGGFRLYGLGAPTRSDHVITLHHEHFVVLGALEPRPAPVPVGGQSRAVPLPNVAICARPPTHPQ